jgi:hypothetical protein
MDLSYLESLPPCSPDANQSDLLIWSSLKDTLYKNYPHTMEELKQEISAAVIGGSEGTLAAVVRNFRHRLQMVIEADGVYTY